MLYEVTSTTGGINFAPATEAEEILQNIRTLLATAKYSVPLDRELGLDMSPLDRPIMVAQAQLGTEIIDAIAKYEPRAEVRSIIFNAGEDGRLCPKVQVNINGES